MHIGATPSIEPAIMPGTDRLEPEIVEKVPPAAVPKAACPPLLLPVNRVMPLESVLIIALPADAAAQEHQREAVGHVVAFAGRCCLVEECQEARAFPLVMVAAPADAVL